MESTYSYLSALGLLLSEATPTAFQMGVEHHLVGTLMEQT